MNRLVTLLIAAGLMCAITGCGDDDPGASPPTTGLNLISPSSISKVEYIERAERLCRRARRNQVLVIHRYIRSHPNPKLSKGELVADAFYAVIASRYEHQVAAMGSLGAPTDDEQQLETILAAMKRAIEGLERRNELSPLGIEREFAHAGDLAREYGIQTCGG